MLLVAATGEMLCRARYNRRVLCTDLRSCSTRSSSTEVVALWTIASATKSTLDRLHARLAHVGVDRIKSSAKHEVSTGLNIKPSTGADPPCVSCVGGKLARHTFPEKGSDAEEALAVVNIDLCGPFRVAAKDGSLYFLLLKDLHTRFVPGGEFLGKEFTNFVDGKGIVHDLTCPYNPEQNGMAEQEMRTAVDSVLDLTNNKVITLVKVIFYEALSLEVWTAKYGPASGRTQAHPLTDTSTATVPLLAEVDEPTDEDVVEVLPPSPVLAPPSRVADRHALTPVSATGDEGSLEASPVAPASEQLVEGSKQLVDDLAVDEEGELSAGEESTDIDVVEVPITKPELRRIGRNRRPPERLSFYACQPPAAFTTVYDEKGEAVKAAMEEEIRSLIGMGTWELVEHPCGMNIMKNWWVLTTKYRIDDTVEREKARLVVKGFTQVCGADYDETYSPVSSYVTLRIFLSIVAILDLNLMQLDMKNTFLQSKLDRVLCMYQPDFFDDGTGRVCMLLKSLYGMKQSPLLCDNGVNCWVTVYVDDLLAASSSPAMLKDLKELLEAAFKLREISPVVKYLGLEIVRDRQARKLWHHQQGYADKLRRCFIDEEQGGARGGGVPTEGWLAVVRSDDDKAGHRVRLQEAGERPHESLELIGYVDADDKGDKQNRTSMGGYVFAYGGAAISWSSSRIKCATLLSIESEYVAATDAGKEGRRLRFLLAEFKLLNAGKPTIFCVDKKSAITVAEGIGLMGNLKHMERCYA
ncbi:unnamed protein product [Closterium sp. NIES-53]